MCKCSTTVDTMVWFKGLHTDTRFFHAFWPDLEHSFQSNISRNRSGSYQVCDFALSLCLGNGWILVLAHSRTSRTEHSVTAEHFLVAVVRVTAVVASHLAVSFHGAVVIFVTAIAALNCIADLELSLMSSSMTSVLLLPTVTVLPLPWVDIRPTDWRVDYIVAIFVLF